MKVLVTGVNRQLGHDVLHELQKRRHTSFGVNDEEIDITDINEVREAILGTDVEAVIHCIEYTKPEEVIGKKEFCADKKLKGIKNVVNVCKEHGLKMMYISTGYEIDILCENNIERNKKLELINIRNREECEREIIDNVKNWYIVRTSWLFGDEIREFSMKIYGSEKQEIYVEDSLIGTPVYTYDLARLVVDIIETDEYGIYYVTNEGTCTKYDFVKELIKVSGMNVKVKKSEGMYMREGCVHYKEGREHLKKSGFKCLPKWKNALKRCFVDTRG